MEAATAARLAWSLCIACLVGLGGYLLLYVLNGIAGLGSTPLPAALTFTVVGALFAVAGHWWPPASQPTRWAGCC